MNRKLTSCFIVSAIALGITLVSQPASAQITAIANSDVEGFFGTNSDGFQLAEGPSASSWGVNGPGFYPVTGLPNIPALYPGFPNPVVSYPSNISFIAPSGHFNSFTDGQTTASYVILGGFNGPGTATSDAYIDIGAPGTTAFTINQPATASGYAFEQVNFAMSYNVGAGGLLAGAPGPRPFLVSGSLATGGWAQFGAQIDYWFIDMIPGTTVINSITNLGNLQYNFTATGFSGNFSQVVNHSTASLSGAVGSGLLVITGDAFIAGDPFTLTITQIVPEPSSIVLAICGGVGLLLMAKRRILKR